MNRSELEKSYVSLQCLVTSSVNHYNVNGVSAAQYHILEVIKKEGPQIAKNLALQKGISQSGVSKLTRRLLDNGYVRQTVNEKDRRSYLLELTPKGEDFLDNAADSTAEVLEKIENSLNEEEIQMFIKLCSKITLEK